MNRALAKVIVRNLNSFAVSAASQNIVRNHVSPSSNPALNILISASVFVAGWNVSSTVLKPVNEQAEKEIDQIADAINAIKANRKK